jgi:parallel beta-helix repeat protein
MYPRRRWLSALALALLASTPVPGVQGAGPASASARGADFSVGILDGDIRGNDHRALQAAVDYVGSLGGGTVSIGPGRYEMRNALVLRDNVRVVGVPGKTILAACDGFRCRLAADGDCNQREITVDDASRFRVGDGVAVADKHSASGFGVTTATITARVNATTFRISRPLYFDYLVSRNATASLAFPVVGGWQVKNATVEGLTVTGNRAKAEPLDGCRGAGIYLFECSGVTIRNCTVREYNGDGISFQVSSDVVVENCVTEDNAGHGLHPGSGSSKPVVRDNRSTGNGQDGMFVCWRVQHGLFLRNDLNGNVRAGISIGHKDSDNRFLDNSAQRNGSAGLVFRSETEAMGAHRNVFERNRFLDNGTRVKPGVPRAAIVIHGHHNDLVFTGNTIGHTKPTGTPTVGILIGKAAKNTKADANKYLNVDRECVTER